MVRRCCKYKIFLSFCKTFILSAFSRNEMGLKWAVVCALFDAALDVEPIIKK